MSNLKWMSLAAISYSQDYNDKLPPAEHWMESLKTHMSSEAGNKANQQATDLSTDTSFRCPALRGQGDNYGYAFNSNVAGSSRAAIALPISTPLIYDSATLTRDASDAVTSLPLNGRHSGGNNIIYNDGHVKWIRVGSKGEE